MAESNPYRPPAAYVEDVPSRDAEDGAFIESGRAVPPGQGWGWIAEAWELFKKRAGAWILMVIVFMALLIGLNLIPVVGWLLTTLFLPLVMAGMMLGCKALEKDGDFGVGYLFEGFKHHPGELVVLGVLSIVAWLVVFIPVFAVMGGALFSGLFLGGEQPDLANAGRVMALGILLMLALSIPVYMALWFAPALVVFHERRPLQAMGESFRACLKNIVPFLVYGVIVLFLGIAAAIPFGLGFLVLGPVIIASVYTAYRDIFFAPA